MFIIGLTGSSGSGKTTVCNILNGMGCRVINADDVYQKLSTGSAEMKYELVAAFGDITDDNGNISKEKLRNILCKDASCYQILNNITFKYINRAVDKLVDNCLNEDIIVYDAPLLFESGYNNRCNIVIGVCCETYKKLSRLYDRDKLDYSYLNARLSAQKNDDFWRKMCDIIIENSGSMDDLIGCCKTIIEKVKKQEVV